jgi:hypothetical protein
MRKSLLYGITLVLASLLEAEPGHSYYEGPWCARQNTGRNVTETCSFRTFEACRQEVIAGNRGFCTQNPRWPGYYAAGVARPVYRKRVRQYY